MVQDGIKTSDLDGADQRSIGQQRYTSKRPDRSPDVQVRVLLSDERPAFEDERSCVRNERSQSSSGRFDSLVRFGAFTCCGPRRPEGSVLVLLQQINRGGTAGQAIQ